ncbi:hypothetical protein AC578_560 [Pseudocercospora eumusae]|uniref:Partial AB-hydrolase lipase domain-containing protein n=1 Tax=Pseudocercospora eumusae TaxID=321146 RepID=A0A139HYN4_9PEZI|nr:hypothetical protein AC578_560 [Pseudocercospora eumusae]
MHNGAASGVRDKQTEFAHQAEKLGYLSLEKETDDTGHTQAAEAKFVTPFDPVIETQDGKRLPAVPVDEANRLNTLKDQAEGRTPRKAPESALRESKDGHIHGIIHGQSQPAQQSEEAGAPLREAVPSSKTNPLFPPLPMYGPPSYLRTLQCWFFRATSAVLSFCFLLAIVVGALVNAVPRISKDLRTRASLKNPRKLRPFYNEEIKRRQERRAAEKAWCKQSVLTPSGEKRTSQDEEYIPTEGGPDPLVVDVSYYARRVGLDAETYEVQTEDGFIIELWHIFNPREYRSPPPEARGVQGPDIFRTRPTDPTFGQAQQWEDGRKRYPILMIHGLLQSGGAFCCNDDDSLAFYLAKSGYDVWIGNNRCGFTPKHTSLRYEDPRMWNWNIRQMGVMDMPALISRVLAETGFPKLGLISHSQGTTEVFVALAKEQRPDIGEKISVFCALAPAAYAGPLIGKFYFKFMQSISPGIFRIVFGIHSFIPLMLTAHNILPARPFSWMGYHVFSYLFSWNDSRWDRGLRDRMFQFAPVYVSAESMRWWLGRECFAMQKCILATREEGQLEDQEDEEDDEIIRKYYKDREPHVTERRKLQRNLTSFHCQTLTHQHHDSTRAKFAWYDDRFPPLAMWVCGADDLVDGRRLLRRFDRGREPHVRVVHKKIIEGYEHLDVIWAMDAIEKVGKEVREVIWRTADTISQSRCRIPVGCTRPYEEEPEALDVPMVNSGGRARMASISGAPTQFGSSTGNEVRIDASRNFGEDQENYEETIDEVQKLAGHHETPLLFERRLSEAHFTDLQEKSNPIEQQKA